MSSPSLIDGRADVEPGTVPLHPRPSDHTDAPATPPRLTCPGFLGRLEHAAGELTSRSNSARSERSPESCSGDARLRPRADANVALEGTLSRWRWSSPPSARCAGTRTRGLLESGAARASTAACSRGASRTFKTRQARSRSERRGHRRPCRAVGAAAVCRPGGRRQGRAGASEGGVHAAPSADTPGGRSSAGRPAAARDSLSNSRRRVVMALKMRKSGSMTLTRAMT
jgi:hypothetical protein